MKTRFTRVALVAVTLFHYSQSQSHAFLSVLDAVATRPADITAESLRSTLWLQARDARVLSSLITRASQVGLAEPGALGEFLVPMITATAHWRQDNEEYYCLVLRGLRTFSLAKIVHCCSTNL